MRNRSILMDNNQKNNKKGLSLTEYEIVLMAFGVALESLRTKSWYTLAGGEPIPVYGDRLTVYGVTEAVCLMATRFLVNEPQDATHETVRGAQDG